jgi:hypothetical protein
VGKYVVFWQATATKNRDSAGTFNDHLNAYRRSQKQGPQGSVLMTRTVATTIVR